MLRNWSHNFFKESIFDLLSLGIGVIDSLGANLVRTVPMLEMMVILDGAVSAIAFAKEYLLYKVSEARVEQHKQTEYKQEVIKRCNQTYVLGMIERYMMYSCIHLCYVCVSNIISLGGVGWDNNNYWYNTVMTGVYIMGMGVVVPRVQNRIAKLPWVDRSIRRYNQDKETFLRYSLSKSIISSIQTLHPGIQEIKNYHIFILYSQVGVDYAWEFVKSYGFIYLLNLLRNWESTYYYYKAIKFAYYYNTGYMFNTLTNRDSVYIINVIVSEKRWRDLAKIEVVNAFYSLVSSKFTDNQVHYWTEIQLCMLKIFMVWSIVCVLKLFSVYINTITLIMYLLVLWYSLDTMTIGSNKTIDVVKQVFSAVIVYLLIVLNVNDIIISFVFIGNKVLYYICEETCFYMKNRQDIQKVVEFYTNKTKSKKTIKTSKKFETQK
ncbi:MAG: hypothetical protein EBU90_22315 [Proteobacteria bacterium]|nr:hypothetical protein [Pseudomonadota bacterium]NBP16105.1 hypothetical protein [bacterium]